MMWFAVVIPVCIVVYLLIAGFVSPMFQSVIGAMLWPITIPFLLGKRIATRPMVIKPSNEKIWKALVKARVIK